MDQAEVVNFGQARGEMPGHGEDGVFIKSTPLEAGRQAFSFDQLHDEVGPSLLLPDLEDLRKNGVKGLGQDGGFAPELDQAPLHRDALVYPGYLESISLPLP